MLQNLETTNARNQMPIKNAGKAPKLKTGEANIPSEKEEIFAAIAEAITVFGNHKKALGWLNNPNIALDSQVPLLLLESIDGRKKVNTLLIQIAHGIYI